MAPNIRTVRNRFHTRKYFPTRFGIIIDRFSTVSVNASLTTSLVYWQQFKTRVLYVMGTERFCSGNDWRKRLDKSSFLEYRKFEILYKKKSEKNIDKLHVGREEIEHGLSGHLGEWWSIMGGEGRLGKVRIIIITEKKIAKGRQIIGCTWEFDVTR